MSLNAEKLKASNSRYPVPKQQQQQQQQQQQRTPLLTLLWLTSCGLDGGANEYYTYVDVCVCLSQYGPPGLCLSSFLSLQLLVLLSLLGSMLHLHLSRFKSN